MAKGGKMGPKPDRLRNKPGGFVPWEEVKPAGGRKSGAKRPSKGAAGLHS